MVQNNDSKDTRKAYLVNELPDHLKKEFEKGFQGRETPELEHLVKDETEDARQLLQQEHSNERGALFVGEMNTEEIKLLEQTEMSPEHDHLNAELPDKES
ncbi:MAG: hypothetical protein LC540_16260 [Candidatus Thiodiazotropha sp.]|nr:hypothetical protein [Candidatus Thiodiazotropha sp.]